MPEAAELAPAVMVTGTSTGIGRACALYLDERGFRVFAGVRRESDGEALRREASARLTPVLIDVTDAASVAAAAETVSGALGGAGLAGLVNNAGIVVAGPLEYLPLQDLRRQLEVNVVGQLAVIQAFLPLIRQGPGRIVNMGSSGGRVSKPFVGPYCVSKFALAAFTDALRMELRPWGIHVSLVEPGPVDTPIWEKSLAAAAALTERLSPEARRRYDPILAAARRKLESRGSMGVSARRVARVVARALTARRPRARYLVGLAAKGQAFCAWLLPRRVTDRIILRALHVPRHL